MTVAAAVAFHGNLVCLSADLAPVENHQGVSSAIVNARDEMPMMFVPVGPFIMGSNDGFPNERPEHTVIRKPVFHRPVRSDSRPISEICRIAEV